MPLPHPSPPLCAAPALCARQDSGDALGWVHFKAEGDVEFRALLFIPKVRSME